MKGEKMVKRSSFGGIRKRLSDITNLHSQLKSPAKEKEVSSSTFDDSSSKNYIEHLLKENAAMLKLVQEKEKVIETSGIELQKLRVIAQKAQLQNWQLAQSNSHMLAELNMGKDRLKALQHELACKEASFKARIIELKAKDREAKLKKEAASHPLPLQDNSENKVVNNKKRRPTTTRSRSMGPTTSQQTADKVMAENKRRCLRRQSVRLKQEEEPQVDLLEIDVANFPMSPQPMAMNDKSNSNMRGTEKGDQESQRSSLGRPIRRAVGKVETYKEPSLGIKMRRLD